VVGTTHDQPDVMWKMYTTSGTYPDLDRFNRVVSSRWTKDLATDKDFYRVDLAYDRNSNITSADEQVHAGFDVLYLMDDIDRLADAEEGTLSGGTISSRKRHQIWTLTHTGNWDREKLDLDGDDNWNETNEHDDTRTHNTVNELTNRNTDSIGGNEFNLSYAPAGNLTDDGENYKYEYDAFYRLRKVKNRSTNALVAEYAYNGRGHQISVHADTDSDGDVDSSDLWYYTAYDERWRPLSTFRSSDTSAKEDFVLHQAGLSGHGGSSYINSVICRYKDANTAWTSASDGTLEEIRYYCQNWRGDVSSIVTDVGAMVEWAKYTAYGIPFGLPAGDTNSDGDCDAGDATQIQTWIDTSSYNVLGDLDLDGDVDSTDKTSAQNNTKTMGWEDLTDVGNQFGSAGYDLDGKLSGIIYHVRHRVSHALLGRWAQRDPFHPKDGPGAYEYARSMPITKVDSLGAYVDENRKRPRACYGCQPIGFTWISGSGKCAKATKAGSTPGSGSPGACIPSDKTGDRCARGCDAYGGCSIEFFLTPGCDGKWTLYQGLDDIRNGVPTDPLEEDDLGNTHEWILELKAGNREPFTNMTWNAGMPGHGCGMLWVDMLEFSGDNETFRVYFWLLCTACVPEVG